MLLIPPYKLRIMRLFLFVDFFLAVHEFIRPGDQFAHGTGSLRIVDGTSDTEAQFIRSVSLTAELLQGGPEAVHHGVGVFQLSIHSQGYKFIPAIPNPHHIFS